MIDDWLDLTVFEAEERGPALKNRFVGEYKGLLDREPLNAADGGQPLQRYVEASLHQRSSECVLLEMLSVHPSKKRKRRDGQVDGQNFILKTLKDSWMDTLPMSALSEEQRQHQYVADVTLENVERQRRSAEVLEPTQETRDRCYVAQVSNHEKLFPFRDNLTTLMFIVANDLSEAQRERERERLTSSFFSLGSECSRLHF